MMRLHRILPLVLSTDWILPTPVPSMRSGEFLAVKASTTEARRRLQLRLTMRILRQRKFEVVGHALSTDVADRCDHCGCEPRNNNRLTAVEDCDASVGYHATLYVCATCLERRQ